MSKFSFINQRGNFWFASRSLFNSISNLYHYLSHLKMQEDSMKPFNTKWAIVGLASLLLAFALVAGTALAGTATRFTDQTITSQEQTCVEPPEGLVSWWDGDSVSGNTAYDIQSDNDGTMEGDVKIGPGKVGNAFSLDGVGDYLLVADSTNLRVSSFTLDAWINTSDATSVQPIIAKAQADGNWLSYMLRIEDGGRLSLIVENWATEISAHWITTLSTLSSNEWHHVAGTWQNLKGDSDDAKIYIDGVEQTIAMVPNIRYESNFLPGYTAKPLYIGRDESPSGYFNGRIDEIEVYSRALTAAEIQDIYNAGSAGKCKKNRPPVAQCQDVRVDAGPSCSVSASINNGSYDPDGDPIKLTQSPPGPYSLGKTSVSLTVSDSHGASSSCTANVTVVDILPPTITKVSATPSMLWPPNHKMVPVRVIITASDNCSGTPKCGIVSVASNEPVNGLGDGDTTPDWQFFSNSLIVNLRAERSGQGSGRIYTVGVQCRDASGNKSLSTVQVRVPHDQREINRRKVRLLR
jgi:hypothetical protein